MNSGKQRDLDEENGMLRRLGQTVIPKMVRRRYSLKFLAALLIVVVGVAAVGGLNYILIQDTVTDETAEELRSQGTSRALHQSQWISKMKSQTQLISGTVQPSSPSLENARQHSASDVVAIHYVNVSQGEVVASTDQGLSGAKLETVDTPWVRTLDSNTNREAPDSTVWITNASYERDEQRVVAFTTPRPADQSAIVLVGSNQRLVEEFGSSRILHTTIYTTTGQHLFGGQRDTTDINTSLLEQTTRTDRSYLKDQENVLSVYAPIEGTDWVAVTRTPNSELHQPSETVSIHITSIVLTSVLLLVVVGTVLGRHTIVPLNRLRRRTQELAENNFDVDLTTNRNDEIGQLFEDFEMMRDALQRQIRETREAKEEIETQRNDLQRLTTRLQLALDETNTGVWEWNLKTDEFTWDDASERLFGYEPGEFPGTFEGFADRVSDEDLAVVQREIDTAIETGKEFRADFRVFPSDHDCRWVQARGVVKFGENGTPERLLGIQTDITDRKNREQTLQKFREAVEQAGHTVFITDAGGTIEYVNPAFEEMTGYDREEALGETPALLKSGEHGQSFYQELWSTILNGEVWEGEIVNKRKDGQKYSIKQTISPIITDGEITHFVAINHDITERRRRKHELEQSNEKLEQFAGVVSHDLRNPLNVILGRVEFIDTEDETDNEEHRDAIERSAARMQDIIDDLLALSRAGREIDDLQKVSLTAVAEDSWDTVQPDGTNLDLHVPKTTTISADRDRLMHVFENLFRNAREHNDPPLTIRVGLLESSAERDDGEPITGFFVEDDGDGIPEDGRNEIFDHGYTTNRDGTGFGLSIVEEIANAHGWNVSVCESSDGGARFEIRTNSSPDRI